MQGRVPQSGKVIKKFIFIEDDRVWVEFDITS